MSWQEITICSCIYIFPACLFGSVNKSTYNEESPVFVYEEAPEYPNRWQITSASTDPKSKSSHMFPQVPL